MTNRKELPRQTVQNLIPPKTDHLYFEAPRENPFQPRTDQFELTNAGWLADASLLVYGSEAFIREKVALLARDLPAANARIFTGPSTQALVLDCGEFVIVAFRGTRIEVFPDPVALWQRRRLPTDPEGQPSGKWVFLHWRDVVSDVKFGLGPDGIHRGFRLALDQSNVWESIQTHLQTLTGRPVWFTGHSLGAALATIAAARYAAVNPVQGLYTFGSPRVGNAAFNRTVPANAHRFVNNNDIVTRLPPPIAGYEHVGTLKFVDGNGMIVDDEGAGDTLTKQVGRHFAGLARLIPQLIRGGELQPKKFIEKLRNLDVEVPDNALNDHAPVNYACRIWNAL